MTISVHLYFCQSRITPLCFSLVFSLFYFPLFFPTVLFHSFFPSASHPSSHPLTPVSTAPPPPILINFIQGLVSFVLCICLKIGLGRETFSCNHKSVRLIVWKALQLGRALFPLEDYYIVPVRLWQVFLTRYLCLISDFQDVKNTFSLPYPVLVTRRLFT